MCCGLSPLSGSVETSRTATLVASISVGATIDTGVVACVAFIHIFATTSTLVKVKSRRTHALEATQCVVAGGRTTHRTSLTLVFICRGETWQSEETYFQVEYIIYYSRFQFLTSVFTVLVPKWLLWKKSLLFLCLAQTRRDTASKSDGGQTEKTMTDKSSTAVLTLLHIVKAWGVALNNPFLHSI